MPFPFPDRNQTSPSRCVALICRHRQRAALCATQDATAHTEKVVTEDAMASWSAGEDQQQRDVEREEHGDRRGGAAAPPSAAANQGSTGHPDRRLRPGATAARRVGPPVTPQHPPAAGSTTAPLAPHALSRRPASAALPGRSAARSLGSFSDSKGIRWR
jgi:hypothetical protein